jgi:transketolase
MPTWDPDEIPDDAIERGAYILRDSFNAPDDPDVILIGTGSEVHTCVEAAAQIEDIGLAARVVSMPCMEHFAKQGRDYRDYILPPGCRARVSLEAASPVGWHRWVGDIGEAIGMETFGASGPAGLLYEHFGLTADRLAEAAREVHVRSQGGWEG